MKISLTLSTEWSGFACRREWWLPRAMGYRSITIMLGFIQARFIVEPWKKLKGETP